MTLTLYVESNVTNKKYKIINYNCYTRNQLAKYFNSEWFEIHGEKFHVSDVIADHSDTQSSSMILGAIVGILGGPIGVLFGIACGWFIAYKTDKYHNIFVDVFNDSKFNKEEVKNVI